MGEWVATAAGWVSIRCSEGRRQKATFLLEQVGGGVITCAVFDVFDVRDVRDG